MKWNFFTCDAVELAEKLIGTVLVHENKEILLKSKIVETEAYMGSTDSASHSYKNKRTERTKYLYN